MHAGPRQKSDSQEEGKEAAMEEEEGFHGSCLNKLWFWREGRRKRARNGSAFSMAQDYTSRVTIPVMDQQ